MFICKSSANSTFRKYLHQFLFFKFQNNVCDIYRRRLINETRAKKEKNYFCFNFVALHSNIDL